MAKPVAKVTPSSQSLLSEPALYLMPFLAQRMSICEALFVQQVHYWGRKSCIRDAEGDRIVCYTYEHWQKQFPFLSTRWLKEIVRKLESDHWIVVDRKPSYNTYKIDPKYSKDPEYASLFNGKLLLGGDDLIKIFATLAVKHGLLEAAILQTVHGRTYKNPSWWVKKTVGEWHDDLLPFAGVRTIERAFGHLETLDALVVEKATNKGRNSKRLRVNYQGLANSLAIEIEKGPPELPVLPANPSLGDASTSPPPANIAPSPATASPLV